MKRIGLLLLLVVLVLSCGTEPAPVSQVSPVEVVPSPAPSAPPVAAPVPPVEVTPAPPEPALVVEEEVFDPGSISEEKFTVTKVEVQVLIEDLNKIIRARNYSAWIEHLADSYLEEINSRAFLDGKTEELYKRDQIMASNLGRDPRRVQKKILRTPRDYFDNVVVPSRFNDRMDDIDFVSEDRVKAYTVDTRGQRLVLYDLEMIDNKWKIIN